MEESTNQSIVPGNMDSTLSEIEPGISEINSGLAHHAFDHTGLDESWRVYVTSAETINRTRREFGLEPATTPPREVLQLIVDQLGSFHIEVVRSSNENNIVDDEHRYENYIDEHFHRSDTLDARFANPQKLMDYFQSVITAHQISIESLANRTFDAFRSSAQLTRILNPINFEHLGFSNLIWTRYINLLTKDFVGAYARSCKEFITSIEKDFSIFLQELTVSERQTSADDFVKGKLWKSILTVYVNYFARKAPSSNCLMLEDGMACMICSNESSDDVPLCSIVKEGHACKWIVCTECVGRGYFSLSHGLKHLVEGGGVKVQCGQCRKLFDAILLAKYYVEPFNHQKKMGVHVSTTKRPVEKKRTRESLKRKCKKVKRRHH